MKFTIRIWIWLIVLFLSLVSVFGLPPVFLDGGLKISSINQDSLAFQSGLREGMVLISMNGDKIVTIEDYVKSLDPYRDLEENETKKLTISTKTIEVINLFNNSIIDDITLKKVSPTRIKTGLDLQGGARAFVRADVKLTSQELDDLISVSEQRLNIYGFSDLKLFKVLTSSHENLMGVEIAGASPDDLEKLIAKQGKFEAKIGNKTVFIGGNEDVTHVGRTGTEAIITECFTIQGGEACNFQFTIFLSPDAAQRHADITDNLSYNGSYLSEQLDFYIDDILTSSLNIGASLKGTVATQIQISGSGTGVDRTSAIDSAKLEMKKLQTILITGSLPYKLEILKLDKISPNLGVQFMKQLIKAGIFALLAVSIIIFLRYRKFKISLALIAVSFSEVIIILGAAALMGWNLDLPSIAGIIAAIGIGIDSQIIILDESRDKNELLKQRIKKALFIIVTAFTTTFVALIPLTGFLGFMGIGAASAGLLKGFAVTTLIGITSGVLISRPAFADIARQLGEE